MDSIDLLKLVKTFGKLEGVEVYGYIPSRLRKPINLFDSCKLQQDGFFVKMDVLAVNLQRYSQYLRERGITNKENDDIYLVNGSVALYVDSRGKYPDWYATSGTLRLGSKTDDNYLTMFPFKKTGNDWSITFNNLYTMDISNWGRQSRLYLSVCKSNESGFVVVPDDVMRLSRFNASITQGVVVPQEKPTPQSSLNDALQTSMNNVEVKNYQPKFVIEQRDTILPKSDLSENLEAILSKVESGSTDFVISLKNQYSINTNRGIIDNKLKFMLGSLLNNLKTKPHNVASTGRVLLKKYLNRFGSYADAEYLGSTAGQYLIDNFSEIVDDYVSDTAFSCFTADGSAWKLYTYAFENKESFYAQMLGIILGVDADKLEDVALYLGDNEISFIKLISDNPYLLLLVSSNFTYKEVDYIAYCLGKLNDKSIDDYKLVGVLFDYTNNSSLGSTIYELSSVLSSKIGVTLTKAKYNQCKQNSTYLSESVLCNIYYYIDDSLRKSDYQYPSNGWVSQGYNYVLPLSREELLRGITLAEKYGIVTKFNLNGVDWITSTKLLTKELYIYNTMYELASQGKKGYDHDLIDAYIDEYESIHGFKLEHKQRDAVHLIDNYIAVVTGPAGSGKTTVSDCMVYVLDKFGECDIEYAAPTGKASKRLQEVVKQPVQTFNSKFKIFGSDSSLLNKDESAVSNEGVTYFFDEVAMTNIDTLYQVCKRLSYCSVFLLGDICQLPPIGKGLPFKNLLRFLPCVELSVTKRSAENSGITYNSNIINKFSEANNWQVLKEFDDFKIMPCPEDSIKRLTILLCKYHLGTIRAGEEDELSRLIGRDVSELIRIPDLTPDDIQVVTPLGKATYSWGVFQLNNALQGVFNTNKGYNVSFKHGLGSTSSGYKFIIGDRVIHIDTNMYSMQWYSSYEGGFFEKRYGFGVSNGDIGKLVAFYPSQSCVFTEETEKMPSGFRYPDNLRDDTTFISKDNWFIVVEYYDPMSDSNYYIVYRATESFNNDNSNECRTFYGDDLKKLSLFYAGTVHKMQGSQARLVIGILGRVNFNGFITRNMLYTEVTRASDGVYLLGSVSNDSNSQLSIARKCIADDGLDTVQELFYR